MLLLVDLIDETALSFELGLRFVYIDDDADEYNLRLDVLDEVDDEVDEVAQVEQLIVDDAD